MINENARTYFAPPERLEGEKVEEQAVRVDHLPLIHQLVDLLPEAFLVLNKQRQIVFCNATFAKMLGLNDVEDIHGLRPGEALKCIHASESEGGCGTTEYCVYCGAVNAIMKSQSEAVEACSEECRIMSGAGDTAMNFRVWAKTLTLDGDDYTIFVARDISDEKRRSALEKIFFHDIMNTAGGINGIAALLDEADKEELDELVKMVESSSATLIEEIQAQKDLLAAESGELTLRNESVNSIDILREVANVYAKHEVAADKLIEIDPESDSVDFQSDPRLIRRIIGNMTKNALEASSDGETVTISAKTNDGNIEFHVNNPKVMPQEAQMQVFQRSFSTKGPGRGLGTYSIKLLGESYLKGKVSFVSEEGSGTTFTFSLEL